MSSIPEVFRGQRILVRSIPEYIKSKEENVMYECPNCGGNLRFDIPTQSLFCDYCHTQLNPYSYQKDHDAVETSTYDVNIFTCPQCGGEILSTENAATGFCSFCGASTILDSRIAQGKTSGLHCSFPDYQGGLQESLWQNDAPCHFCP